MVRFYEFAAPAGVFRVRSAVDLAAPLALYAGAWPWRAIDPAPDAPDAPAPDAPAPDTDVEITAGPDGGCTLGVVADPSLRRDAASALETAGGLIDVLTRLALERLGSYADLHAGAALVDGALVVMPGPSQAGKSTLALQLCARGHRLAGDDRLLIGPLSGGEAITGMALGLNARARLPVHVAAGRAFADYVSDRLLATPRPVAGLGFVALRAGEAMAFGERAAIGAIVLPQRADDGGIRLEKAAPAQTMRALLEQMHAPHRPAADLVAAARALAFGRPGYVLRFDDSAAAAAAIEREMRQGGSDRT